MPSEFDSSSVGRWPFAVHVASARLIVPPWIPKLIQTGRSLSLYFLRRASAAANAALLVAASTGLLTSGRQALRSPLRPRRQQKSTRSARSEAAPVPVRGSSDRA